MNAATSIRVASGHDRQALACSPRSEVPLVSVELFAGAGGMALGLQQGGFSHLAMVERDEQCRDTLMRNQAVASMLAPTGDVVCADVRAISCSSFSEVDLLSAGAPCQPFSHGGRRRGALDERNLFPEVIRAVYEIQPRAFLIENVRGLLFGDMQEYFRTVLRDLRRPSRRHSGSRPGRIGRPPDEYKVFAQVLNAADFGVPQSRQRLFIVGVRPDLADSWCWPKPQYARERLITALLDDAYWDSHDVPSHVRTGVQSAIPKAVRARADRYRGSANRWLTVRDLLREVGPPASHQETASDPSHYLVPGARLYPKHTGSKLDWPSKTIKAGVHGCPGGEHIVVLDDGTYRYLSVRECASLQGFPSSFVLPTVRTTAMRQIGNAVPPPVAAAMGRQLAEVLRNG